MYTLGSRADLANVLVPPESVGAELVRADRGGDVTYHGPGQLVGYPIVSLAEWRAGQRDVVAYVRKLEAVLVAVLADLGVAARGRADGLTGVWVGDEKIAAIGVRVANGRTRHGFALNVDPDLTMFSHIVPCGIPDKGVTSIARVLGARARACAMSSTVSSRGSPSSSVTPTSNARTSCGASSPTDLSRVHRRPRSRAAQPVDSRPRRQSQGAPVRLLGRLARGRRRTVDRRRPARVDARAAPGSATGSSRSSGSCAISICTPCASRRGARTSSSAGPIAPPRS